MKLALYASKTVLYSFRNLFQTSYCCSKSNSMSYPRWYHRNFHNTHYVHEKPKILIFYYESLGKTNSLKLIMWKDKRDVLMISTRPSRSVTVVNPSKTNIQNERTMQPQVVLNYNKGRQGSDLSDQLSAYYTCLRRSIKWYRKVAFELIFRTAIVNSYLIYKKMDSVVYHSRS